MQGRVKITAILINPDGVWEDEFVVQFAPEQKRAIPFTQIGQINQLGGLVRIIDESHIQFIPLCRIKDIDVAVSEVLVANMSDLAAMPTPSKLVL